MEYKTDVCTVGRWIYPAQPRMTDDICHWNAELLHRYAVSVNRCPRQSSSEDMFSLATVSIAITAEKVVQK